MNLEDSTLALLLARLAAGAGTFALLAFITGGIALAANQVFALQGRSYLAALRQFLTSIRARKFLRRGLAPGKRLLAEMTTDEALQILHAGAPHHAGVPRGPLHLARRISRAELHPDVLADFDRGDRETLIAKLLDQAKVAETRWRRTLTIVCIVIALLPATLFQVNVFDMVAATDGRLVLPDAVWPHGSGYFAADPERVSHIFGVLLSAILCGIIAARVLLRRIAVRAEAEDNPVAPEIPTLPDEKEPPRIGEPGAPIRAINFSSGGFDTLMHLGVIHALVVIHGRAPDAVVGLSAGAIHAAALPEVLQAGGAAEKKFLEDRRSEWSNLQIDDKRTLQRMRVFARVERLRHFIERAQRAPERLLDAILPDASQVDAGQPLHPLRQPRLSPEEREERHKFVATRFGLARLYDDILNVPLRISTLAKAARRVLGIIAANDIRSRLRRRTAQFAEFAGLWVLLGANLLSLARLARVILLAYFRKRTGRESSAAGVIFRMRKWQWIGRNLAVALLWMLFATMWLALSYPVLLVFWSFVFCALALYSIGDDPTARIQLVDVYRALMLLLGIAAVFVLLQTLLLAWQQARLVGPEASLILPWSDAIQLIYARSVLLALVLLIVGLAIKGVRYFAGRATQTFVERLLSSYGLGDAIFRVHGLRTFLLDVFDSEYYARASVNRAVEAALDGKSTAEPERDEVRQRRTLADYYDESKCLKRERIHVGIAVANTETGGLEVVRPDVPIVDALIAATALTPWFPPAELLRRDRSANTVRKVLYIAGGNVTREPTHAMLKLIRERRLDDARVGELHIYSVSPFPLSTGEAGPALSRQEEILEEQALHEERAPTAQATPAKLGALLMPASQAGRKFHLHLDLIDIAWRAIRMRRLRDAGLEFRLTRLFTEALPPGPSKFTTPRDPSRQSEKPYSYFRARVKPVELEYDGDLNQRLYRGAKGDRRRIIAESIADGCRAALQVMIRGSIEQLDEKRSDVAVGTRIARCWNAVNFHLNGERDADKKENPNRIFDRGIPGSNSDLGPGLSEICEHCTLLRPRMHGGERSPRANPDAATCAQRLRITRFSDPAHDWPHERVQVNPGDFEKPARSAPRPEEEESKRQQEMRTSWKEFGDQQKRARGVPEPDLSALWPAIRKKSEPGALDLPVSRPLVSLLFSGGVFRGVYQIGVLSALNQLRLRPDIVAGASVGSITAAMISESLSLGSRHARRARIARLAATYLAIDRLVLTDRLADFVRTITLRASETRFSVQDADMVFRRYDQPSLRMFDRKLRRVVAGFERLFALSPYELNALVRALRESDPQKIIDLLQQVVQRFLDRMQVGEEILGTEALRDLITNYVIGDKQHNHPIRLTIDALRESHQIMFLATATNLTLGRLEVLGEKPALRDADAPVLEESLLASSAFPGGFRPRWSWEITPGAAQVHQFIDGGVMDNMPIDAIAAAMHRAAKAGLISRHPPHAPHLIVGASLETKAPSYALPYTRKRLRESWIRRNTRAGQLGFNSKLDMYEFAEQALRDIYTTAAGSEDAAEREHARHSPLVDIQLVSIKPDWLCGAFAFHPMLGFTRERQARSIAHGCATTLLEFAHRSADSRRPEFAGYTRAWGIPSRAVPAVTNWEQAFARPVSAGSVERGACWLRPAIRCPFSRVALEANDERLARPRSLHSTERPLGATLIREISRIHEMCHQRDTHLKKI
jgi:predicted acylesterase/phospholipase RssA